jgi:hypothetical protein
LGNEVQQLAQFIYLGFDQFRMLRGFQEMKKTQQACKRLQMLNIANVLETFHSYISDDQLSEISLPHRENLNYVLIKLQGLSKVLLRIISCAQKATKYLLGLVKMGSFYIKGTIFSSTLAYIWNLSRNMCKYTVNLYNKLMQTSNQLKSMDNVAWIAKDCRLPDKLDVWLGSEYEESVMNETCDHKLLTKSEELETFINSRNISTIFENSMEIDSNHEKEEHAEVKNDEKEVEIEIKSLELDDYVPLSRENAPSKSQQSYNHSIESINTKDRVMHFIKEEDKYRKVNVEKSITIKKIKNKGWKEFKKDLNNKINLMQEHKVVEYFMDSINDLMN